MSKKEIATHKCSFCNKDNTEVKQMVAGPGVSICNECVFICVDIMINGLGKEDQEDESGA